MTPEYKLRVAAIEIAAYPPVSHDSSTTFAAKVPWRMIEELRDALDAVGVEWRK